LSKHLFSEENSVPFNSQSANQVCKLLLFSEYILYMSAFIQLLLTDRSELHQLMYHIFAEVLASYINMYFQLESLYIPTCLSSNFFLLLQS